MDPQPQKAQAVFVGKATASHLISYIVAALLGFYFLTGDLYVNPHSPLKGYLATPGEPELWKQVLIKIIPIELVRGFLFGIVLSSVIGNLKRWGFKRRFLAILAFYFILGFLASPGIAPGSLEGMLYMQNKFAPTVHEKFFWVTLLQSVLLAVIFAKWIKPTPPEE